MENGAAELRVIELWQEADQLHRALLKYGDHTPSCAWTGDDHSAAGPCTCGWLDLRDELTR